MSRILRCALATIVFATVAAANTPDPEKTSHHCRSGVPFEASSTTAPPHMRGIGSSHFPITTQSTQAQAFFDQGINMLHAFWDFEAYRAFREAARLDPEAAMPQWGLFTALGYNAKEMKAERDAALARAIALAPKASEREQFYIRAAALLVEPGKGRSAFISEMEALIDRYPNDVDAKLFLANTLSTPTGSYAPDGRPREGKLYGQSILRNLLHSHPEHAAVHHYWIHAVENGPRPQDALESAVKLPRLAPAAGHLRHMPGHIYYRIGRYAEARTAFHASMEIDLAYMKSQGVSPVANWNYVHNLDYLVGNCAEDGRFEEGVKWARVLASLAVKDERLENRGAGYIVFGGLAALPRLQMRYGRWLDAIGSLSAALTTHPDASLSKGYLEGLLLFLRGMEASERSDAIEAKRHSAALSELAKGLASSPPARGSDWYGGHAARILNVHSLELQGVVATLESSIPEAVLLLQQAADSERELGYWEPPHYARPVYETLARVHMRARNYEQAEAAWERALALRPNSGHALLGLAQTQALAGRVEASRATYRKVLEVWSEADDDLPQLREARAAARR